MGTAEHGCSPVPIDACASMGRYRTRLSAIGPDTDRTPIVLARNVGVASSRLLEGIGPAPVVPAVRPLTRVELAACGAELTGTGHLFYSGQDRYPHRSGVETLDVVPDDVKSGLT